MDKKNSPKMRILLAEADALMRHREKLSAAESADEKPGDFSEINDSRKIHY
jgi:hypothetical protein